MSGGRDALERERDFLLDAIRRLDDEHAAGVVADHEYRALRDETTARAAAVLRDLDAEPPATSSGPPVRRPLSRRFVWVGSVAVFVALAAAVLVPAVGDRMTGDVATGEVAADSNTLLARASEQTAAGRPADALETYDAVLDRDPRNVQALAYRGWLIRLAGLPNEGLKSIEQALAVDPRYPDAHFFKGFILLRDRNDPAAAVPEFEAFLANDPPKEMEPLVRRMLDDARAQIAGAATPAGASSTPA